MRLTAEQVKALPDGTVLKVFLSGEFWQDDFGKVCNVIKMNDKLYEFNNYFDIDDIDDVDFQIIVACKDAKILDKE